MSASQCMARAWGKESHYSGVWEVAMDKLTAPLPLAGQACCQCGRRASGPGGRVRELRAGRGEPTRTVLSAQGGVRTSFPRRSFWLPCLESGWAHRGTRSFSINM